MSTYRRAARIEQLRRFANYSCLHDTSRGGGGREEEGGKEKSLSDLSNQNTDKEYVYINIDFMANE